MVHSFLLIGQSNMAGRGHADEVEPIVNDRIKVLRNGRWQPMYVPVNPDRRTSGVCLAESFADAYTKDHDAEVGLIPCADGGTALCQWMPGELLFDHALMQCRLAMRTSELAGILWHQGEGDCREGRYLVYEEKCRKMFTVLREELGLPDVPILVGGLGDFLVEFTKKEISVNYMKVNAALQNVAATLPRCGFVSAEGLTANPEIIHFNAVSLREFGLRYYEKFRELEDRNRVYQEKEDKTAQEVTGLEAL